MKNILLVLLVLFLCFCLFMLDVMGCCGEPSDPYEEVRIKDVIEPTGDYIFDFVVPICIRGHEYYYARYGVGVFAVSHFDDDGKPVKCGPERNVK